MYDEDYKKELIESWSQTVDAERVLLDKAKHRRNLAVIADFATNLLAGIGHSKGLRYSVTSSPLAGRANEIYNEVQNRYRKSLVDYNGKIAALNLMKREQPATGDSPATAQYPIPSVKKLFDSFLPKKPKSVSIDKGVPWQRRIFGTDNLINKNK